MLAAGTVVPERATAPAGSPGRGRSRPRKKQMSGVGAGAGPQMAADDYQQLRALYLERARVRTSRHERRPRTRAEET